MTINYKKEPDKCNLLVNEYLIKINLDEYGRKRM
jgi:hypothetical protein